MGTLRSLLLASTSMIQLLVFGFVLLCSKMIEATPVPEECCKLKTVGDYNYTLVDVPTNVPSECLNSCAYARDGEPGSKYCFAPGDQPVTCQLAVLCGNGGICTPITCPPIISVSIPGSCGFLQTCCKYF